MVFLAIHHNTNNILHPLTCEQVDFTWARPGWELLNGAAIADILRRSLCSLILDVLTFPNTRQSLPVNRFKH